MEKHLGDGIRIVDSHVHLWLEQNTVVNGKPIYPLPNGRAFFMDQEVQMLPPFMTSGRNDAETLLSNMDYARVSAAVVTQEFIDGLQNDYLRQVALLYPGRFFVFGMPDTRKTGFLAEAANLLDSGFKGIKIPAARLLLPEGRVMLDSPEMIAMFHLMEDRGAILGIELADGDTQVGEMKTVIQECPGLKIAIGHFGMVTRPGWMEQIRLARYDNVYVESGGITWLFNDEFYPYPSAMKAIRQAADEVGIHKLMWGSDYPRTITAITYRMSFDFVLKSDALSGEEKAAFLGLNAKDFFGFGPLKDIPWVRNMSE